MSAVLDMGQPLTEAELDTLIDHVAQGVTPARGSIFFEQLVEGLARAMGADFVSVGQVTGAGGDQVRTLALYADGAIRPDMTYPLADSPCEQILTAGLCVYAQDVQQRFPRDRSLAKNHITGYAGAALYDANGSAVGTLAVMSRRAISRERLATQLVRIFAERASVELDRQLRDRELERRNQALLLLNELTDNLHRSLNRSRLAYQALNTLMRHGLANGALLYLQDGSSGNLELTAWQGVDDELIGEQSSPVTLTHHMQEWDSGAPWLLGSCPAPKQGCLRTTLARLGTRDAAVIPLGFMGRRLGALELLYHEAREFSTVELDTLRAVGRTLSLALMNADHFTEIEYQALHDPLTGLPNRKRFHRDARQVLTGDAPMALLLLDLNRFGEINNTLGHHTGDELLRGVARRLGECLAVSALISRLSADEFAILLPVEDDDGEEWLGRTTRMILTAVSQPFQLQGMGLEVNASIGISL